MPAMSAPPPPDPSSLRHQRPLVLFWCARLASMIAFQVQGVAVGWQIYALTGSPLILGLVGLAQFLPMFLLTLPAGHFADRRDRRAIARTCQAVEGLAAVALAVASFEGRLSEHGILAIVFVVGAARAFEAPTLQALLPGLVPAALFPRAAAATTSASQTAVILGPALGGVLYAAGPDVAYATAAVLFFVANALIGLIRLERTTAENEPVSLRSVFAGIAFIRSHSAVLGAISLDLFAVLLGGATALLPIYARDILHSGPLGLGLLRSAPAVGALAMSVVLARRPLAHRVGRIMFGAVAVFGLGTIVFAVSTSFALSLAALAVLGGADVISVVIRQSLVQIRTPVAMRGRVSAVNWMFIGTSNQLGEFESGATAALFGTVPAVVIGGVGTLVVVAVWMRLFPELLRFDSLDE
jgi:MFS family permease